METLILEGLNEKQVIENRVLYGNNAEIKSEKNHLFSVLILIFAACQNTFAEYNK